MPSSSHAVDSPVPVPSSSRRPPGLVAASTRSIAPVRGSDCIENASAVELHPWTSTVRDPHRPTWALFDIDPGRDDDFTSVLALARLNRTALDHLGVEARPKVTGQRGIHILQRLALEGLLCFASSEGKQQTFALLEEWVPAARTLEHDEALAELAGRYFQSNGPATVRDFTWWSGLTVADAKLGIELAGARLEREIVDGQSTWLAAAAPASMVRLVISMSYPPLAFTRLVRKINHPNVVCYTDANRLPVGR